ncbi:MAG: type II toxin-antitoxin system VapC family toxin [Micrococcales bacterium]|nr:type II toxin-antitoxin system VapC family toxin [Micrococcales bacterium]
MTRYLLDTNTVSFLFRSQGQVAEHLSSVAVGSVCISSVTEAELRYGVAKNPSRPLATAVDELCARIAVVGWTSQTAKTYGTLRAHLERTGTTVALHDLLIAAHATELGAILVTHDHVFAHVAGLATTDWY